MTEKTIQMNLTEGQFNMIWNALVLSADELVDEDGYHWSAEMDNKQEAWLVYSKLWTKDPQQPLDL